MKVPYIPKEILHVILQYDGRIHYRNGKYMNSIDKNDDRYNMLRHIISKKLKILNTITIDGRDFYFQFGFSIYGMGLCYDHGFNEHEVFEICYYDIRKTWLQIRTYI